MALRKASPPKVAIFTITYNQDDLIGDILGDLSVQSYPEDRFEVIVLNDGSTDNTRAIIDSFARESAMPVTALHCSRERDYMSARRWNQCMAAAPGDTEVFVQIDDVRTQRDFLEQHVKWHDGGEPTLVTGAKFNGSEETWDLSACRRASLAGNGGSAVSVKAFTAVWAASLSFPRSLMEAVYSEPYELPYDERMEGWGFHEVELALRMQKAGARIVYDPAAGVFHRDHTPASESLRGLERERLRREGEAVNKRYILEKHDLKQLPRW